jgi:hypothetical protein
MISKDERSGIMMIVFLLVLLALVRSYFIQVRENHLKEIAYEQTSIGPV